jgi:nicotinamide-nucleotide amidase
MNSSGKLRIEIIAVGSELLTPYYQDTNSLYLTRQINDLGMSISLKTIVGDNLDDLIYCFRQAQQRSDLILIIGGLGPTLDDKTREAVSASLNRKLFFKKEILHQIKNRFRKRNISMPSVNKKQAYIIEGAEILNNKNGTAPGLWVEFASKIFILLPGPPVELKAMFEDQVLPRLLNLRHGYQARLVLKIAGLTESKTESLISDLYPEENNLEMTTLAYPGQIEIHLTGFSISSFKQAENKILKLSRLIRDRLKEHIFSASGEKLEEVLGKLLSRDHSTLATAESCTGGLLGHRITNVPGSSDYFLQGVQVYSNKAKIKLLGISESLIETQGAVSQEVAEKMSERIREKAQSSYGLAITGIAGPGGGTKEKPVGLVYTSLAWENGVKTDKNLFSGNREIIKFRSSQKALDMLRMFLIKQD